MADRGDRIRRMSEVARLMNHELTAATSHPTRVKALGILRERDASAGDIGKEIGRTAKHVKYHLDALTKVDLVEVVAVRSTYGGRVQEKIFRAKKRPFMDADQWKAASEDEQIAITVQAVSLVSEDVTEAMLDNSINWPQGADADEYEPNHISRTPFALDRQGWNELTELLEETLDKALVINEQAAERGVESEERLIAGRMAILQFRSPPPQGRQTRDSST
jgi:predicted ArsR family transcriptional regulator